MHILNVMFSAGLGGIEQSFVDYTRALSMNNKVFTLTRNGAEIIPFLPDEDRNITVGWPSMQNPLIGSKLRKILKKHVIDVVVCHGGRAIELFRKANCPVPIVAPTHNYNFDRLLRADALLATTDHLANAVEEAGYVGEVFTIPNMIDMTEPFTPHPFHNPPVIGSMGRFVEKKGFDRLIDTLAVLKTLDMPVKLLLGGEGEEYDHIEREARQLGVSKQVEFLGWVEDKKEFFNKIDIFCLPSLHEPFGIVLLEAMAHSTLVVATDTEGPSEIIIDKQTGFLVPKDDPRAMADILVKMLKDEINSKTIANQAYNMAKNTFSLPVVAKKIDEALGKIVN